MASVLVVDDEEDIRDLLRINLELDGHHVTTVASGPEALECLRDTAPDVIVLDLMMPGMDGWEVLTRLKMGSSESADVPVLLLTARADDMDRIRGGIEGAIHYITKPFTLDDLRSEVRKALEGEPESVKRRRAQHEALERLARLESGAAPAEGTGPRPRLTKLETPPETKDSAVRIRRLSPDALADLSLKQRELLDAIAANPTVRAAAEQLHVSRSNVYASLRRIARKLDVKSVPELVALIRQGGLTGPGD
ncbi:MAG TPA: response regulator [Acidimicrobiales bacterium]|nr:response regulator [Acidimicrobiales bacterium]